MDKGRYFWFEDEGAITRVKPLGVWRLENVRAIVSEIESITLDKMDQIIVNGSELEEIDTTGALLLFRLIEASGIDTKTVKFEKFNEDHLGLVNLVQHRYGSPEKKHRTRDLSLIEFIGKNTLGVWKTVRAIFSFIGETVFANIEAWRRPAEIRVKELFVQLEFVCLHAIPVVSLVTFLIGVVIAYLFAIQIEKYGGNIFIVDAVALAMCRELSPVLVAIIVAGRSGSAFTAQIGTMKLNEEVDAMRTLGLSPMQVLVLPRFYALIAAMPLLVFIGDVMGIFGGMLISDVRLGITGITFIQRLQIVLPIKSLFVGLIKAPVFAAFIAVIGCRLGLSVEDNARSVGLNTTATVVQSIVSVILLNAAFAVIFQHFGI